MKDVLEYKGYVGSIEYSLEDNILFGKALGVRGVMSYEGETLMDLRKDFEEMIDTYLDYCKNEGITPEKPFRGSFNVRITPEEHRKAAMKAETLGISLNKFVRNAILTNL